MSVFGKLLENLSKEIGKTISKSAKSANQARSEKFARAKNADSSPSNTTSKYEIYSTITPQTKELANLQSTKIRANLDFLKSTHPEIFSKFPLPLRRG